MTREDAKDCLEEERRAIQKQETDDTDDSEIDGLGVKKRARGNDS